MEVAAAMSAGAESTLIAAAIVTVVGAIAGNVVLIVNAVAASADRRASRMERAALTATTTSTDRKADTIIEKAVEIHTLTNSNLSNVTTALNIANEKIQGLEKQMALLIKSAAETHAAAELAKAEVSKARAEVPPDSGVRDRRAMDAEQPVKVEVVNEPLIIHDAMGTGKVRT